MIMYVPFLLDRLLSSDISQTIREPRSGFYKSPLVVLDFQSLYPSIMIAYNYCYSTCLGRITSFPRVNGTYKLGWTELDLPEGLLGQLKGQVHGTFTLSGLRRQVLRM